MRNLISVLSFRILRSTFYSTLALAFCAWVVQSSRYLDMISAHNVTMWKFLKFSSFLLVDIVSMVLPISLSASVAFVYHRFGQSNQLVAMQSFGISTAKLLKSLLFLAASVVVYLFISNAYLSPKAWIEFRAMEFQIRNNIEPPENAGTLFSKAGFSVYAQEYCGDFFFKNLYIVDFRNPQKTYSYYARSGSVRKDALVLAEGERIEIDNVTRRNSITSFGSYHCDLKNIFGEAKKSTQPNEKFMDELLVTDGISDAQINSQKALFHQKITSPLLAFVFSLLSFFLILMAPHQRKKSYIRMISLVSIIVFFYGTYFWIANAAARDLRFACFNYLLVGSAMAILLAMIFCKNKKLL